MISAGTILTASVVLLTAAEPATPTPLSPPDQRFAIEVPNVVLTDVPVSFIRIEALDANGNLDTSYNKPTLIHGIKLIENGRDTALPAFRDGVLKLTTEPIEGRKVYITASEIVVDPESRFRGTQPVVLTLRWFSLVPPLLAIVLAIWLHNVILALFVAVWSGAVILSHGNFFNGFIRTLDTYLIGELAQVKDAQVDHSHLMIIFFTMFLGAMVGVMSISGGTTALVNRLARITTKREHGQLMTWGLGLVVCFDDYANTMLVGSTMRPVTDRLSISREKLAFLVDSTAAPVAALAIVSTWVGLEIGSIGDTYTRLGLSGQVFDTFLYSLPYCFYPLHLIVFVWMIAYTGHDYGPMLKAEVRALSLGQLSRPGETASSTEDDQLSGDRSKRSVMRNALVPLATLMIAIVVGLWWTGGAGLEAANREALQAGKPAVEKTVWTLLGYANSNWVLFLSSFVASIVAVAVAVTSRSLTMLESMDAWARGAKTMFLAILILVLAWGVARICDADHLNTAGFIVELCQGQVSVAWMPTLVFLLAAATSFATGSSWTTLGLLMPLSISLTHFLLLDQNDADPNHPLMLGTIGAVLAGSVFGNHCSPISDSTVLSSAMTGCDHLDHVATQLPYAGSVALVSLLFGYLPVGFRYSPIVLLPLGLIVLFMLVQFLGRPCDVLAKQLSADLEPVVPVISEDQIPLGAEPADDVPSGRPS